MSVLVLSSHLNVRFPNGPHPSGLPVKALYVILLPPYIPHALPIHISPFDHLNKIR